MTTLVELRDVVVAHGTGGVEVRALDAVDFDLRERESVALWGPSGSGKTTLLHVLGGLVTPSSGRAQWRGEPLVPIQQVAEDGHRSQRVAYVFQGSKLLPTLTAYENVAFAGWASGTAGNGARPPEALLGLVGLEAKLDALPGELSGGESQRVAIARALAQKPHLMLCDEPTAHLDSDTAERVLDLIGELQRELRFALVVATHDAGVAARLERSLELLDGKLVAEGALA
jgi:ABC-type lipoprotein export system ATPase subunit